MVSVIFFLPFWNFEFCRKVGKYGETQITKIIAQMKDKHHGSKLQFTNSIHYTKRVRKLLQTIQLRTRLFWTNTVINNTFLRAYRRLTYCASFNGIVKPKNGCDPIAQWKAVFIILANSRTNCCKWSHAGSRWGFVSGNEMTKITKLVIEKMIFKKIWLENIF